MRLNGFRTRVRNRFSFPLVVVSVVLLAACGGGGGGNDDDGQAQSVELPRLDVADGVVAEGDSGTTPLQFTVTLSEASSEDVTVDYATDDGTAAAASDYTGVVRETLTIAAGDRQGTITVSLEGDAEVETDETFTLRLSGPGNAELGDAEATGTILNDDFPVVSIARASALEGDAGVTDLDFVVSMNTAGIGDVTVDYTTSDVTADAGSDYTAASNATLTLPEGQTRAVIAVAVLGDTRFENDETLTVSLANLSSNAVLGVDNATGTILTDDEPQLTLAPADIVEGDGGTRALTFAVTLEGPTGEVTFDYSTLDGDATLADNDYVGVTGAGFAIPAGQTTASISIDVIGDTTPEADERFTLQLSNVSGNVVPLIDNAAGTIVDDDTAAPATPQVRVGGASIGEGDDPDTVELTFEVTLDPPAAGPVTLGYATADGGAVAGSDYTQAGGTVTFQAGETQQLIRVTVIGDSDIEDDETFVLDLDNRSPASAELITVQATGRIIDDDGPAGPPRLHAGGAGVVEGDSGSVDVTLAVALSAAAGTPVSVDYRIEDAGATEGSDYTAAPLAGTLDFPAGTTERAVTVTVFGDTVIEADEQFRLVLSNLTGDAMLGDDIATGTIVSDDPFAQVRIDDASVLEGDPGTSTDLLFTVTLDQPAADPVDMDFEGIDVSADNNDDYVLVPGTLVIPAGATEGTIAVQIEGDDQLEIDEEFTVALSRLSGNARFEDAAGQGFIVNDDASAGWGLPQQLSQPGENMARHGMAMNAAGDAMAVWSGLDIGAAQYSRRFSANGGWAPVETVTGSGNRRMDVAMDGAGNAFFGFIFGQTTAMRHVDGLGWGAEVDLDPGVNQEDVDIAASSAGDALIVWKSNTATFTIDNLMYSRYDPVNDIWQANAQTADFIVFEEGFVFSPVLAMHPDTADAAAVWTQNGVPTASLYDSATDTWSTPEPISDELSPGNFNSGSNVRIAMDANGYVTAVWNDSHFQATNIWTNRYDPAIPGWTGPSILDQEASRDLASPQIALDDAGNAFVIWLQDEDSGGPDPYSIWARRYDVTSDSWSDAEAVADPALVVRSINNGNLLFGVDLPQLAVDGLGNAMVLWSQDIAGDYVIRASRYTPAGGWGAPEPVNDEATTDDASLPRLGMDAAGNVEAIWLQQDPPGGQFSIWRNRFTE